MMGHFPTALYSALTLDVQKYIDAGDENLPYPCISWTPTQVAAWSIARSFTKKYLPSDCSVQDQKAYLKFLACNEACRDWSLQLNTSLDEELFGTLKEVLDDFFYPKGMPLVTGLDHIFETSRCGPGAALLARNGDFYTKLFASELTTTSNGLYRSYVESIWMFPEWAIAEQIRSASLGSSRIVRGSKLSFVPKNDKISRSICTEPSLNMFYQLGLGSLLERRLRSFFGIDLSTQPDRNRHLAQLGSVTDFWSTIDLESASDSVSLSMLKAVLPKDVFSYFAFLRSPTTTYESETIPLHMVSSMGNGFTFPLQTTIFAACVKSVYISLGLGDCDFGVFGDDIAVHKAAYPRLVRLLTLLGFKVNIDKSFKEGPFKESCGHDYWRGTNVRGVYVKSLASSQDYHSLANLINEFTARTGVVMCKVMTYIMKILKSKGGILYIPPSAPIEAGIRVPLALATNKRYDKRYQTWGYESLRFVPKKIRVLDGYIATPKGMRSIMYNNAGLLISLLAGVTLSSGLPRRGLGTWKKRRQVCSFWNSLGPDLTMISWQQFQTAVTANLSWF